MGTVERGESNLSFANIAKMATALEIQLSTLFLDIEAYARTLAASTSKKRGRDPKRTRG